ncbi:Flp pilus assembly complex ATPase component TadA [Patescibacteria group bacterium]|nr:Flp pilus assembly complex ATPase component TadA [Patescibacteria group bacterium]MBU4368005.1 Flp pilus assembly complex ATPase component TadA [Patescibacteria group bacterium]MBU4462240.1 Flp pilus assembly complex ATPase component TadA [Patescibacteria group bacterium]MCG2699596.1 Flp pilus assembly complex ATPase component TadA [Candidatus Parcubacteria bacterium]
MKVDLKQLKSSIIEMGLLNKKQCEDASKRAEKNHQSFEDLLIIEGLISQNKLSNLKAFILGVPFVNLEGVIILPEILKIIPEPIARTHNIIAFRKDSNNLEVAMINPEDLATVDFIGKKANLRILPRLTTPDSIKNALGQYQKTLEKEFGNIIKKETDDMLIKTDGKKGGDEELKKVAEELPIIKIVDTLLKHAILQGASDIHIEPSEKEMIVRYRIDGILRDVMVLPVLINSGIVARIKVLSNLKLDEHRLPQDGRFKFESGEDNYSVRVSILPIFDGEKIVMRLLSENTQAISLEQLGLSGAALDMVEGKLRKPVGMTLVTGPTGSGKTTTLYSVLEILNTSQVNISTIEDPVEYRIPRINQTQVNSKIGLTFASGLRSLVRQDPNVIMVGEIRDNETASLAINASLTGHLVLSTLHTISAAGAIPRLIDMEVEPFLLSSTLNIIIAQRLVRKLSSKKEKYTLKNEDLKNLSKYCDLDRVSRVLKEEKVIKTKDTIKDVVFYHPQPSPESPDGYSGRIGIYEVLNVTETIKEMIVKRNTSDEIQAQAQKEGMKTMIEDGFVKAARGITTIEEVLRVIMD